MSFSQLYRFDLHDNHVTLLTDGKRSQNGNLLWNNSKNKIAYTSTQRNGADRDIWTIDPASPDSNKLLVELKGGGWYIGDWSPDDAKLLIIEMISINFSRLYLVDVASGTKTLLTEDKADVAHPSASFAPDGKGIYFTTDAYGEFQQLCYRKLDNDSVEVLTRTIPWDIEGFEVSSDGKFIALTANEAGQSQLYILHTDQ